MGFIVKIANGQEIASPSRSWEVEVRMQGQVFRTDLFILTLAGCNAVLGIQWIRTLGPILWDFTELKMEFLHEGVSCTLLGLKQGPPMSWEEGDSFKLLKNEQRGLLLQLIDQPSSTSTRDQHPPIVMEQQLLPAPMAAILRDYGDFFRSQRDYLPTELKTILSHCTRGPNRFQ
jgi:hypothetical protein